MNYRVHGIFWTAVYYRVHGVFCTVVYYRLHSLNCTVVHYRVHGLFCTIQYYRVHIVFCTLQFYKVHSVRCTVQYYRVHSVHLRPSRPGRAAAVAAGTVSLAKYREEGGGQPAAPLSADWHSGCCHYSQPATAAQLHSC